MSFLSTIRDFFAPPQYHYEIVPDLDWVFGQSPGQLWRQQPHLRTVVNFGANQVAQLGIHSFRRVSDTDRERISTGLLPELLSHPNPTKTSYELVRDLVADIMLYDRAIWYIAESNLTSTGWIIQRIPVPWVRGLIGNAFGYEKYRIQNPNGLGYTDLPADNILEFHGYDPDSERDGSSPVHALKEVLAEQLKALAYRNKVWDRGGRVSSVIERPAGVRWNDDQRRSFKKDWNAKFTGDGSQVGGTPILEDGMKLVKMGSSEAEQQFIEATKLSLQTVAQVYLINPTMVGLLDNANYSNVKEFRKMLYGDALGPMLRMVMDRLNTFMLPKLGITDSAVYMEFNLQEKLRGDFEQQATSYQTAVGGPWMTRAEARARNNLPALPESDADELIVPLNVLVGGQASPTDSGEQNEGEGEGEQPEQQPKALKSGVPNRAPGPFEVKTHQILRDFFEKQRRVAASRKGAKDALWWDSARWDRELAPILAKMGLLVSESAAGITLQKAGIAAESYDVARTEAYFNQAAKTAARRINELTEMSLEQDIDGFDPDSRAKNLTPSLVTRWSAFGSEEAGRQQGASVKTWVAGKNSRPGHASLDGETVDINGFFSDGSARPGGVPNCNCTLEIGFQRR